MSVVRRFFEAAAGRRAFVAAFGLASALGMGPGPSGLEAAEPSPGGQGVPVILDTDIGGDIDDTWALFFALRSPEIHLKLITTDHGNTRARARLLAKLLEVAGRTDIPIGIGIQQTEDELNQGAWVEDYDLASYPGTLHQDGVQALVDTVMGSEQVVTLIAIGPVPNIAAALAKEPRIAEKARFVGMHGSLRVGYGGQAEPDAEWNVRADAASCRAALGAAWEVTITPLDTCGLVKLSGARFARIRDSRDPLAVALMENYRIWHMAAEWTDKDPKIPGRESSTLFDTVAVYLAFSEELLEIEPLGVAVNDEGFTVLDPDAKVLRCATAWKDMDAFEELLVERLTSGGEASAALRSGVGLATGLIER
jgi:inosine-uridine nucleoside N-ribohydrolase